MTDTARALATADRRGPILAWALGYALRRWPLLLAVLGILLLRTLIDLLRPWPLKVLIDDVLAAKAGATTALAGLASIAPERLIVYCALATLLIFGLARAATALGVMVSSGLGRRLTFDVAEDLFSHLQRQSLGFHHRTPTGEMVRRIAKDASCASVLAKDFAVPLLASVVTLAAMFVVLYRLNAPLALLAATVAAPIFFLVRYYAQPLQRWSSAQHERDGRMYAVVERTFSALPAIQTCGREEDFDARFRRSARHGRTALLATTRVQVRFKFLIGAALAAGTGVVLWLGARQVIEGTLSVGSLLVFLSYLAAVYAPLESLAYMSAAYHSGVASARRVHDLLTATPQVCERPGAQALHRARGAVAFERVSFGYEPGQTVLNDIDLAAAPGERIAVVGRTGAGKSTLLSLIPRFMDACSGAVRIDGVDVRDLRLRDLRSQVAIVPQDPLLFPVSIAENIAYGRPEASPEEVREAARAACADAFIQRLPRAYDTIVGQRGATLSLGQRQRISIARALLKDAPILILDEPTSALDVETEAALMRALERLLEDRTAFIIAHRIATAAAAQRIAVLEAGRLLECGTQSELLARGGHYCALFGPALGDADRKEAPVYA